jgi:hypothetical protein
MNARCDAPVRELATRCRHQRQHISPIPFPTCGCVSDNTEPMPWLSSCIAASKPTAIMTYRGYDFSNKYLRAVIASWAQNAVVLHWWEYALDSNVVDLTQPSTHIGVTWKPVGDIGAKLDFTRWVRSRQKGTQRSYNNVSSPISRQVSGEMHCISRDCAVWPIHNPLSG